MHVFYLLLSTSSFLPCSCFLTHKYFLSLSHYNFASLCLLLLFRFSLSCANSEQIKLHRGIQRMSKYSTCDKYICTVSSVPCDGSVQLWLSHLPTKTSADSPNKHKQKFGSGNGTLSLHYCQFLNFFLQLPPIHTLLCCSLLLILTTVVLLSSSSLCSPYLSNAK